MTDKEVGDLWSDTRSFFGEPSGQKYWMRKVRELIRLLVEERKKLIRYQDKDCSEDHTEDALANFHIDPETWKKI